jgi:hypothetical protein
MTFKVTVGDSTLSVLEIWGAEYQENNALLIKACDRDLFESIARRENCPVCIVGEVSGDGKIVVRDSLDGSTPVDLPLELVLGKMPQKTFKDEHLPVALTPVTIPEGTTIMDILDRVLRLLSVGSKRFLVHKVCSGTLNILFMIRSFALTVPLIFRIGRSICYRVDSTAAVRRATSTSFIERRCHCSYTLQSHRYSSRLW